MAQKPAKQRVGTNGGRDARLGWRKRLDVALHELSPREFTPQRLLLIVLAVAGFTVVLSTDIFRQGITWQPGQKASRTVIADRTVTFPDDLATEQLRRAARDAVPKQYTPSNPETEAIQRLDLWFGKVDVTAATREEPSTQDLSEMQAGSGAGLTTDQVRAVLALSDEKRIALRRSVTNLLLDLYRNHEIHDDTPRETDLQAVREKTVNRLRQAFPDTLSRDVGARLIYAELRPNRLYDAPRTDRQREDAVARVEPVRRTINRGEPIIERGQTVTEAHQAKFEALGLVQRKQDYRGLLGTAALVLLVLVITGWYVRREQHEIYMDLGKVALLCALAMGSMAFFRLMMVWRADPAAMAHTAIFCGATMGMLITVLVDYRLAMMMTGVLALFLGLMMPGAGIYVAFEAWLAGRVGAMALRSVSSRADLVRAALATALGGMIVAVAIDLPHGADDAPWTLSALLRDALYGSAWGLLSFLVSQGLMPLLERLFGVVTPFRLLELTNSSSPALALLRKNARGSFDSSLTIGDMAAEACEAIGADALVARAAGYHHDLGKVRHPTWFVENQFGAENIHDRLEPTVSAKAIKSHVTEGLQLADEYNLPRPLKDAIAQHHGTSLISFFYYQAKERLGDTCRITEEQFRYDGPKPQSKECGVIMLADGVEAAVRAAAGHGPMTDKRIGEIVHRIMDARLKEGQLDECPVTLADLTLIAASFCEYLRGMYHGRMDYPTAAKKEAAPAPAAKDEPAKEAAEPVKTDAG
ncbi:MAG: HDIG domain-containing protein [Armatimonadetes bacterium]|nr:HDIG domain-containing protein [Armatimonadota bacterium]